jgi:hypothetical protein
MKIYGECLNSNKRQYIYFNGKCLDFVLAFVSKENYSLPWNWDEKDMASKRRFTFTLAKAYIDLQTGPEIYRKQDAVCMPPAERKKYHQNSTHIQDYNG